jgi:hypothetical protein
MAQAAESRLMRIPANPTSDSNWKPLPIPTQTIQWSERSDAGVLIISEVDGFGQTERHFSTMYESRSY